ncbi:hypothetical protein [Botrimarina hoheduenensis]|uniref:LTXXQ motif protein n=1 Tax=Botrimarina hoheduenensis TaxID=2528000 RepID=A0A5C5W7H9_9BACT|nr:hypothetical protein [Botrimarina hoheduenensis]TWT46397.1 hypothetical protein Pla111_14930 [Botrimarina hoheduenensis]
MKSNKKKNSLVAALVGLVFLLAAGAWALGVFGKSVDPRVLELEEQAKNVFGGDATEEQRAAFREGVQSLTDAQRRELFERGRPRMQEEASRRMNELFSLPKEQLQREISDRADRIVAARRERENRTDQGPPGGGPGGGGGRWGNMSEEQRDSRRKQMLDQFEPGMRAQFSEFRAMVNDELESRGEEPMSGRDMRAMFGGGRGGGPGGGGGRGA